MDWSSCTNASGGVANLTCIGPLIKTLIDWLLAFSGAVAVFLILFSGIKFITSGADPKQVDSARKTLTYAVLGLVIILSSFMIINFIADTTGANCIKLFGFSSCS